MKPAVKNFLKTLESEGYPSMVVGGAVRDSILGRKVGDYDVATAATPEQVAEVCAKFGHKTIPTGLDHGTITVLAQRLPIEVTTLRSDGVSDGRRAKVTFGASFEDDAKRRDFTVNAIYQNLDGELYDPQGGLDDIKSKTLRFIGNARDRLEEDHLRALRYFRFLAQLEWDEKDLGAQTAISELTAEKIGKLSKERVFSEMVKLVGSPDPRNTLKLMIDCGLWGKTFEEHQPSLLKLNHLEELSPKIFKLDLECRRLFWITMLFHDLKNSPSACSKALVKLLKPSKGYVALLKAVLNWREPSFEEPADCFQAVLAFEKTSGVAFQDLGVLCLGMLEKLQREEWTHWIQKNETQLRTPLGINGRDLKDTFGLTEGPRLGEILLDLQKKVWAGKVSNDLVSLVSELKKSIQ